MEAKLTITVAMDGAAWLAPSVVAKSKEKFVAGALANPYIFPAKTEQQRSEMLSQVWDIANKMENGNGTRTAKKPKKR